MYLQYHLIIVLQNRSNKTDLIWSQILSKVKTETESQRLGGRIPNATEWPLDNLFQRHNNNSRTAYISVNFYIIYMIFTYNSIIMLTWRDKKFSLTYHAMSHWLIVSESPTSIDNQSSIFFPSSLTTLRFQINIINTDSGMSKYGKFILYKPYLIKITDQHWTKIDSTKIHIV